MNSEFSLFRDQWIRVKMLDGTQQELGLEPLYRCPENVGDILLPPIPRLVVIRLMMAMKAFPRISSDGWGLYQGFLQCDGLPRDEAKTPKQVIDMVDDGGMALDPRPHRQTFTDKEMAIALVTAIWGDRPGFKTRLPGLSISGGCPLHIGRTVAMRGATVAEVIENYPIEPTKWVPWWDRPISYEEDWTGDMVQYLLWPWRRVQVFSPSEIVIAPGQPFGKGWMPDGDPWVLKQASPKDWHSLKFPEDLPSGTYDITSLALQQALPLSCWQSKAEVNVSKEDEKQPLQQKA